MRLATAEPFSTHLMLSTRLVYELGDPHSTLRATTDRSGPAVLIHAGGEIDACNEGTWRQLLGEAAAVVAAPGPFVVDVSGLDFMACCAFATLAEEAEALPRARHRTAAGEPPADRGANRGIVWAQPDAARLPDRGRRARGEHAPARQRR